MATDSNLIETEEAILSPNATISLTQDLISKLRFRDLRRELEGRQLETTGTTGQLRTRLREATLGEEEECVVVGDKGENDCEPQLVGLVKNLSINLTPISSLRI